MLSMSLTVADDLDIIGRLRTGDSEAIEILMERFAGAAYRVAYGITRNAADAEEVVQDVFVSITRTVARFEGRAALWTWLYRVVTNAALNKRRGKRREVEVLLDDALPAFEADGHREGDRGFLLADWSGTPESELIARERSVALHEALDRLPEAYRVVIVLRDVEERSTEEAARILGETIGSVKSRLHRARMALREELTRTFTAAPQAR
jgi:RNA polymerase sigma-70 factor, ECF subfamily